MGFMVIFIASWVVVLAAAGCIKRRPWLWYCLACAFDIVYAYGIVFSLPPAVLQVLSVTIQRCLLATSLFSIVMFCGVFSDQSLVRRRLGPIRAEISIIACILAFAHCLNYFDSYFGLLNSNMAAIGKNQLASLALAVVLFALMVVLGVTSLKRVKQRMRASVWKRVQRSAYVFFALIYAHELLVLYPSAVKGTGDALATCISCGVVFALYFVLRFARYAADKKKDDSLRLGADERRMNRA